MAEWRFEGRTAIITGAGGDPSLGRAHAMLLAARGANVVVNDIGQLAAALDYPGIASAEAVAAEIRALGGKAIADTHSVTDEAGAEAMVQTALDAFGSVDILVNNAGVCRVVSFEEMSPADFRHTMDVNLMGTVNTCRAVWPHMKAQKRGRIINTASGSMAGYAWQSAYAAAKAAVMGFTRSLAAEGAEHGIRANILIPGAFTRMVMAAQAETSPWIAQARDSLPPELVSPTVGFLAHDDCPVSGECIESMGGHVDRVYLARTPGFSDNAMTIEAIAERWHEVMAGAAAGLMTHEEADPRQWHIKPYVPLG